MLDEPGATPIIYYPQFVHHFSRHCFACVALPSFALLRWVGGPGKAKGVTCYGFWDSDGKLEWDKGKGVVDLALICFTLRCFALLCIALLCFVLLCFALHCYVLLCFALHCFAALHCIAMLCAALLCFALLCFALLCIAVLCFALLCIALH